MELDLILLWFAVAGSAAMVVRAWLMRPVMNDWLVLSIAILVVTGGTWWVAPDQAGWVAGVVYGLAVIAPLVTAVMIRRSTLAASYRRATALSILYFILHPTRTTWFNLRFSRALRLLAEDEGATALEDLATPDDPMGRAARATLLRMSLRWEEALAWLASLRDEKVHTEASLANLKVRALLELGRRDDAVKAFQAAEPMFRTQVNRDFLLVTRLALFAFHGAVDAVERLLTGPLAAFPPSTKDYWRAISLMTARPDSNALQLLEHALPLVKGANARAIRARLEHPLSVVTVDPETRALLEREDQQVGQEQTYGELAAPTQSRSVIGWGVTVIAVTAFLVDVMFDGLWVYWGLHPSAALREPWRLVTHMFVHAGALHLVMNLIGLWILVPLVERTLGRTGAVLIFLVGGTAAGAGTALLMGLGVIESGMLVGASGGVMALLGAHLPVLREGVEKKGSPAARRKLVVMGVMVVMQWVFDIMTPQVSFSAHSFGILFGALLAVALMRRRGVKG